MHTDLDFLLHINFYRVKKIDDLKINDSTPLPPKKS